MARTESMLLLNTADRKIMELQRKLVNYRGNLIGKKLLKQGTLRKCNRKGNKKEVHLFLLTDVMLYTKYRKFTGEYYVAKELSIRGMEVVGMQENEQPVVRDEPLSFTVTSKERALHLVASTHEEKETWMKVLRNAVVSLHGAQGRQSSMPQLLLPGAGLGARAPVWVPDTHVTACQLPDCNNKFSLVDRKHHCRQCGRVVCNACSTERRYLLYLHKEGRVCDKCVEAFSGHQSTADPTQQVERSEREPVMCGYVMRLQRGRQERRWYCLYHNILEIYGAHEDTTVTHSIIPFGYSVQGDQGSYRITLTHHQAKEELNDSFIASADSFDRWLQALKTVTKS
jgi:hypothetical protein